MRVDLAKYIILHHYGGFYVDMDSVCKKCFDSLAKMSKKGGAQKTTQKVLPLPIYKTDCGWLPFLPLQNGP